MKKINIILSAIGLLSVVGGALAFKAQHRFSGSLLCYTTVGAVVGGIRIYKVVKTVRYESSIETTLICTVPAANNTYKMVKVSESL